jgi:hypothetical protein
MAWSPIFRFCQFPFKVSITTLKWLPEGHEAITLQTLHKRRIDTVTLPLICIFIDKSTGNWMSFAAMWGAVGVPTTKAPINVATFVSYVLPPVLFYLVMVVLAITPQTRALRVAFWPVVALFALRAAVSVDMTPRNFERKFHNDLAVSGSFGQSF